MIVADVLEIIDPPKIIKVSRRINRISLTFSFFSFRSLLFSLPVPQSTEAIGTYIFSEFYHLHAAASFLRKIILSDLLDQLYLIKF